MSFFHCPSCNERTDIFRHGGGKRTSDEIGVPFLGEIPLDPAVVVGGDEGTPIVIKDPSAPVAQAYLQLAQQIAAQLSKLSEESKPAHAPIMPGKIDWK